MPRTIPKREYAAMKRAYAKKYLEGESMAEHETPFVEKSEGTF